MILRAGLMCFLTQVTSALAQAPANGQEIAQRIEQAVNAAFASVEATRRKQYAERITVTVLASSSSPRLQEILDALPAAASYHATHVSSALHHASTIGISTSDLAREGYDLESEYLNARVARALTTNPTEAVTQVVDQQISLIFDAAMGEMRLRFQGEGTERLLSRIAKEKAMWQAGETSPFNSSMDLPLAQVDLDTVLNGIRSAVRSFPPATVTLEDLRNPDKLKELGIADAIQRVLQAADKATEMCFKAYAPYEDRADDWKGKIEQRIKEFPGKKASLSPPPKLEVTPAKASSPPSSVSDRAGIDTIPAPLVGRNQERSNPSATSGVFRSLMPWLLGILAVTVIWITMRRRSANSGS